ncbi:Hypothetical protein NTJ_05405 [Nesidiocoris tenuis]|uniref:Uncharacterized protein n=1 Tax=Nesidiocoris tenuis TaxID=355587 RepID=A0ABN7ANY3_9HEMI|nr:Hypothetical protein NTJ_05405 [Nesidiocoris tenuis]
MPVTLSPHPRESEALFRLASSTTGTLKLGLRAVLTVQVSAEHAPDSPSACQVRLDPRPRIREGNVCGFVVPSCPLTRNRPSYSYVVRLLRFIPTPFPLRVPFTCISPKELALKKPGRNFEIPCR